MQQAKRNEEENKSYGGMHAVHRIVNANKYKMGYYEMKYEWFHFLCRTLNSLSFSHNKIEIIFFSTYNPQCCADITFLL